MTCLIEIVKILKVAGWWDEAQTSRGMWDLNSLFLTLKVDKGHKSNSLTNVEASSRGDNPAGIRWNQTRNS